MKAWCVRVVLLSLLWAIASPALAADVTEVSDTKVLQVMSGDWSLSAGGIYWFYQQDGLSGTANGTGALLRLGHQVTPTYGWEVMVASGGSGDISQPLPGLGTLPLAVDLDLLVGGHFRPVIADGRWQVYGLIGVSYIQVSAKSTDPFALPSSSKDSALGLSFGGGGEVTVFDRWALGLEWVQYVGGQFDGLSVLVKRYF